MTKPVTSSHTLSLSRLDLITHSWFESRTNSPHSHSLSLPWGRHFCFILFRFVFLSRTFTPFSCVNTVQASLFLICLVLHYSISLMAQRYLLHQLLQEDQEPFLLTKYISDRRSQIKRPFPNNTLQVKKRKSTNPSANFPGNLCKSVCLFSLTDTPDFRKSPLFEFASAAKSPCKSPNAIFLHIPSRTASMLLEAAVRIQKHSSPASRPKTKAQSFGLLGSLYKRLTQRSQKKREIEGGGSVKVSVKDILRWDSSVGRKKSSNKKEDEETVNVNASVCEVGFACSYNGRTSSALWSETNEDKSLDLETSSSGYSEEIHFLTNHKNSTCFCESPFRFVLQTNSPSSGHHTPEFPSPSRHATEVCLYSSSSYYIIIRIYIMVICFLILCWTWFDLWRVSWRGKNRTRELSGVLILSVMERGSVSLAGMSLFGDKHSHQSFRILLKNSPVRTVEGYICQFRVFVVFLIFLIIVLFDRVSAMQIFSLSSSGLFGKLHS